MGKTMGEALERLEEVVHDRIAAGEATSSYVASLAAKGRAKIAHKLGEEAVETWNAAVSEDDSALIGDAKSAELRVGKACDSTWRSRWSPIPYTNKNT